MMNRRTHFSKKQHTPVRAVPRRRGTILIVTMWIILVLAGLVLILANAMRVEAVSSANEFSSMQAQAVEQGAIQYVLSQVDSLQGQMPADEDVPCQAVNVGKGAFWIIREVSDDGHTMAYGLTDEAGKLHINTAPLESLSKLPGMTDELAACMIDWRDADSNITTNGAESEYYMTLSPPYQCKNARFETVEELFMVKGALPEILLGEDVNRNGILDANENDSDDSLPADNRDGNLDVGIVPLCTVYSMEPNQALTGSTRVNVNTAGGQAIVTALTNGGMSSSRATQIQGSLQGLRPFRNVIDFAVKTKMTQQELAPVVDMLTTQTGTTVRGMVNVNTAPAQVLACLPGLEQADADLLAVARMQSGVDLTNIAWVMGVLTPAKAAGIGGMITTRSYQFSADIVSVSSDGRAFRRCRIVVDASSSPPKVIYRQDLTHLGWPLPANILSTLRAGGTIEDVKPTEIIGQEVAQ